MDPTLDRTIILKSVSIFSEIPDDCLAEVALLLQEIAFAAGTTIFEKGEMGTCMYIIVEGQVRVHDGERTLNYLGKRAVFGEMSVLDPAPRSASVTTAEDTMLFRLDREPLYALMDNRTQVAYGMIHILCQHLRARLQDMSQDYQYIQQFAQVTAAAAAVETGVYEPESLDEVAKRTDALGQLARVFQRTVRQVYAREQRLQQQVAELRIEVDKARQAHQVNQITGTDYFQQLRGRANALRNLLEEPEA